MSPDSLPVCLKETVIVALVQQQIFINVLFTLKVFKHPGYSGSEWSLQSASHH